MKDKLIIILLLANLLTSCGDILEEANANGGYQLVNLYGYQCITNYSSIWCN